MTDKPIRSRGSIEDVAREAQVSRSTASRVLRGLMKVLPETREKIFAAAEKVSYRPNVMARALRTGEMQTVGIILTAEQLAGALYGDMIAALKESIAPHRLKIMVSVAGDTEDPVATVEELAGWCTAVAIPGNMAHDYGSLINSGNPVILLDWIVPEGTEDVHQISSIGFDQADGIRQAIDHLVAIGHRNIAYIGSSLRTQEFVLRERGFRSAMEQALLPIRTEWIFHCDTASEINDAFENAISGARCRLSGIVCATDALALEISAAIRRRKFLIPDNFSVFGYGDTIAARLSSPQLTTISHSGRELGEALAQIILANYGGDRTRRNRILPARTVIRDTTAPRRPHAGFGLFRPGATLTDDSSGVRVGFADGIYELEASHSGMMLDVPNAARTPGCHVWQWQRNGTTAQLWHITRVLGEWYRIRNVGSWLYLDADASQPGGCPVVTNPMNENNPDIQLWKLDAMSPGSATYRITNKAKDLVVDFAYGSLVSNELVIVYPWNGNACQQWITLRVPFLTDVYEIVALHSSRALDVPGQSRASGIVPCQADRARTPGQRWRLLYRGGGFYQIQSMLSNLMLQVSRQPTPRVMLSQDDPEAGAVQLWRIEVADVSQPSYRIKSKALEMVLQIHSGEPAAGVQLEMSDQSDVPHQQWLIYDDDAE